MSNKPTTSDKQFSFRKSFEINGKMEWSISDCFSVKGCPYTSFDIAIRPEGKGNLTVRVRKRAFKSGIAVIELSVDNMKSIKKYVNDWKDYVIFEDLLIPINCDVCPKYSEYSNSYCQASHDYHKYKIPISCLITWYGFNDDLVKEGINYSSGAFLKNSLFSDVRIIAKDGVEIPAHRVYLGSSSPVINALFATNKQGTEGNFIYFPELDSDTADELLHFIYCGRLDKAGNDCVTLSKLAQIADKYCFSKLKMLCDMLLTKIVSSDNYASLLKLSKDLNLSYLKRHILYFIEANMDSLCQ